MNDLERLPVPGDDERKTSIDFNNNYMITDVDMPDADVLPRSIAVWHRKSGIERLYVRAGKPAILRHREEPTDP